MAELPIGAEWAPGMYVFPSANLHHPLMWISTRALVACAPDLQAAAWLDDSTAQVEVAYRGGLSKLTSGPACARSALRA